VADALLARLRRVGDDLEDLGLAFALVGGIAVGLRTQPRFTKDVDLAIAVQDDTQAESLVHALHGRGYRPMSAVEQVRTGRLATVRFCVPGSDAATPQVDLLFATSGIESEIVSSAECIVLPSCGAFPVAQVGHLIATKVLSQSDVRLQDRLDLRALLGIAAEADLDMARAALRQIAARGFAREKDLLADLEEALRADGDASSPQGPPP